MVSTGTTTKHDESRRQGGRCPSDGGRSVPDVVDWILNGEVPDAQTKERRRTP
jgi:hypothetical protein